MIIKNNIKKIILCAIILLALILGSLNIFIISLSIFILNKVISPSLNKDIFNSIFFKSVLIFFVYIVIAQCSVMIAWLINHNFPLDQTTFISLILISFIYFYKRFILKEKLNSNQIIKPINLQDYIPIIISALIVIVTIVSPIITQPHIDTESTIVMSMINGNVDDSSHLGLMNDSLQFNRGVLFNSDNANNARNDGFYPAGWQSISSILVKTFVPNIKTGTDSMLAYGILKFFWIFIIFYLLIKSSYLFYVFITRKKNNLNTYIWLSLATGLLGSIFILPIAREGFYSLLPLLISSLLAIPLLIQICLEKEKIKPSKKIPSIIFLVLVGGCLPWFLPLPAFLLATFILILIVAFDKKILNLIKNISYVIKDNLIELIILATAILTQLFIMSSNKDGVSFIEGILLDGGITKYSSAFYTLLCIGVIFSIMFAKLKAQKSLYIIISFALSILLFSLLIYIVQITSIGNNAYYYYKVLNILTVILIPICIVGLGEFITSLNKTKGKILEFLIYIMFLIVIFISLGPNISTLAYAGGHREFPDQVGNSLYYELKNNITQDNYFNKKYTFYYTPGVNYFVQNEVATYTAKSNEPSSNCFSTVRRAIWGSPQINLLLTYITEQCKGYTVDIVTDKDNFNKFNQAVIEMNLTDSIKIKSY